MQKVGEIAKQRYNVKRYSLPKGKQRYNVNVKEKLSEQQKNVERIAWMVVEKLDDPKSLQFFMKCAWHLSENDIWSAVEAAKSNKGVKHPAKYATAILSRKLAQQM